MTRLELAIRNYDRLQRTEANLSFNPTALDVWFREDVTPALEQITHTRRFRDLALWPLKTLKPGAGTPERMAIEEVARSLNLCAQVLSKYCNQKLVLRELKKRFPPQPRVISETIECCGDGTRLLEREMGTHDPLKFDLHQLACECDRSVREFVNPNDYFEPESQWTFSPTHKPVQHASTVVALNPDLLPVGNFIVRRMLARIEEVENLLQGVRRRLLAVLNSMIQRDAPAVSELQEAWENLRRANRQMEPLFRSTGKLLLVDSCIACTQMYAAIHHEPDLQWIDIDENLAAIGIGSLRSRLSGLHSLAALDRLAAHLTTLRTLNVGGENEPDFWGSAIACGGLALNRSTSEAFWQEAPLSLTELQFKCLWLLATEALKHRSANLQELYGELQAHTTSTYSSLMNRLRTKLPQDLRNAIECVNGSLGHYRLNKDQEEIHLIQ
ncbi:hypothetical protein [Planctomicrobium sp. SH527]|uniref:hypothetical protein n=1 Tax=Planctomicrobium sp. SH527 TaxID=3448123 RepID=UPI003F5C714F